MDIQFEEVEPNVWKPEVAGESLTGVLVGKDENVGQNNSKMYSLENKQGLHKVWGCTVLDDRMSYIKIGDIVRITYKGKEKNKRNQDVNIYKVEKGRKAEVKEETVVM